MNAIGKLETMMAVPRYFLFLSLGLINCSAPRPASLAESSSYASPATCQGCHAEIARSYKETGMAKSFAVARADLMATLPSFMHEASGEHYRIEEREGKWFLRRHQLGKAGEEINVFEKEIHYVMGSGNHARTYLHQRQNGELVELPVGWYAEAKGNHAMSPGYDHRDHPGFRRTISSECMFCHNGYPEAKSGKFAGGIGCQRCHGPGQAHVNAASAGSDKETVRKSIFNPRQVSQQRQLEVCLQCHLESTSRALPYAIRRFDRDPFSYEAQEELNEFVVNFDFPEDRKPKDHFEIAHHGYRMMQSRCYLASGSQMTCTTCHDPHAVKRGPKAFNNACLSCHQDLAAHAGKREAEGDCAGCHMPKRRTDDVVHVIMTDHKVQRRPGAKLLAQKQEIQETARNSYKGPVALSKVSEGIQGPVRELYLAVAQVYQAANLQQGALALEEAIRKFEPKEPEFYHQLAEAHFRMGGLEAAEKWYRQALVRDPAYLPGRRNLGATLTRQGKFAEAVAVLEAVGEDAASLNNLGEALLGQGNYAAAETALRRAVTVDPDSPDAFNNLGAALNRQGKTGNAVQAWREALRSRPAFALAHNNLANALAAAGQWDEAKAHFQEAVRDAGYSIARFNFGTALAERGEYAEAERWLLEAAKLDPAMADAYLNLGNLYLMSGRAARAVAQFEEALRVRPGMGKARLNLGLAFAELGRFAVARGHLEAASRDGDDQVRRLATQALQQIP